MAFIAVSVVCQVIRPEIRKRAVSLYPSVVMWGASNASQHAGFQALWAQYDHVVPHSCGGSNELDNLVVACAPCNFGKMSHRLAEIGLLDPRDFEPLSSGWDGLERFLKKAGVAVRQPLARAPSRTAESAAGR